MLTGVNFGTANITGSAPGYGSATKSVTVGSALAFSPPTGSVTAGGTSSLTLTLSGQPAPANGLTINLMSSNTGAVTVPASVFFAGGATNVQVPVTGVNQGSATITASTNTPNVTSANATVTVGAGSGGGGGTPTTLAITTTSLPTVTQNQAYTATLTATGGTMPYFFNASALPSGLMIVGNQIVGTTSLAPSSRNVTISVSDSGSPAMSVQAHLVLTIVPPGTQQPLAVATSSLPNGTVGAPYTAPLSATGGTGTFTFSASGLPTGLSVVGTQITGTPSAPFSGNVTITVTDSSSATAQKVAPVDHQSTRAPDHDHFIARRHDQPTLCSHVGAIGGSGPYTFAASGLPNGLGVSGNQITGTTDNRIQRKRDDHGERQRIAAKHRVDPAAAEHYWPAHDQYDFAADAAPKTCPIQRN